MKLGDICSYRTTKFDASEIRDDDLYISTESMAPNRGGVSRATNIPESGKVTAYKQGDTLISNIRPYFKKVWQASCDGYCSNDVLVMSATESNVDYLYWLTSSDSFFDYVMATAKGTKMPRGDKTAIMNFEIPPVNSLVQRQIVAALNPIRKKISINAKLNGYLEELLFSKYNEMFPDSANFTGVLSDVGEIIGGATPSKKKPEYYCSNGIGWITPRDLSNTSNKFIAHGADDITDAGYASCSVKLLPKGSVLFSSRAPIGYIAIATDAVTTNQGFKSVIPKEEIGTAFVYCFLVRNKQRIADMGAGTTFPELSSKMMKSVELAVPKQSTCAKFASFAAPIFKQQEALERENDELTALRDTLLPKLLSGEIDVSKVDLTQLNSHLV